MKKRFFVNIIIETKFQNKIYLLNNFFLLYSYINSTKYLKFLKIIFPSVQYLLYYILNFSHTVCKQPYHKSQLKPRLQLNPKVQVRSQAWAHFSIFFYISSICFYLGIISMDSLVLFLHFQMHSLVLISLTNIPPLISSY